MIQAKSCRIPVWMMIFKCMRFFSSSKAGQWTQGCIPVHLVDNEDVLGTSTKNIMYYYLGCCKGTLDRGLNDYYPLIAASRWHASLFTTWAPTETCPMSTWNHPSEYFSPSWIRRMLLKPPLGEKTKLGLSIIDRNSLGISQFPTSSQPKFISHSVYVLV